VWLNVIFAVLQPGFQPNDLPLNLSDKWPMSLFWQEKGQMNLTEVACLYRVFEKK